MRMLLALLGLCCAVPAYGQEKVLWGSLRPGPYAVGFHSQYELDSTRAYDPDYPKTPGAAPVKKPRPIFIAYWYPASAPQNSRMAYGEYLDAYQPGPAVADFAQRLSAYNREVTCAALAQQDPEVELAPAEEAACDAFLSTRTFAARDARPAAGRYPVIVYHAGLNGSYEDNSVLCEFLASHGYVVLSTAYANADASVATISWDLSTTFADTAIVLRVAATLPFADTSRLGAVGHSFGAQATIAWHAEPNSPLDAAVALDTTVEYGTLEWPGFAPLKVQLTRGWNGTAPVLLFASSEKSPRFDSFDTYLRFASRYEASVASLEHQDYISHGAVGKTLHLDPAKAAAVRLSYDRVCTHTWKFLDAYVKRDAQALAWLDSSSRGEGLDEAFQVRFKAGRPIPPTGRQIVNMLDTQGPAKTRELLARVDADLDRDALLQAGKTLTSAQRLNDAVTLYTWATEIFPNSAQMHQVLGDALKVQRAAVKAKEMYAKALELLESDPEFSDEERVDAREEIQEAIETLDRQF
jgi:dienelactone hydrolase